MYPTPRDARNSSPRRGRGSGEQTNAQLTSSVGAARDGDGDRCQQDEQTVQEGGGGGRHGLGPVAVSEAARLG